MLRAIVVDDNLETIDLAKFCTAKNNKISLIGAFTSPSAAIDFAKNEQTPIDIFFLDVMMPDMMGDLLAYQLLQITPHSKAETVFLSSYSEIQHIHQINPMFLPKPFDKEEMNLKINTILKRKKSQLESIIVDHTFIMAETYTQYAKRNRAAAGHTNNCMIYEKGKKINPSFETTLERISATENIPLFEPYRGHKVNLDYLTAIIDKKCLLMDGGFLVPISKRNYTNEFFQDFVKNHAIKETTNWANYDDTIWEALTD